MEENDVNNVTYLAPANNGDAIIKIRFRNRLLYVLNKNANTVYIQYKNGERKRSNVSDW